MAKNKKLNLLRCCRVCGLDQGFEPWENKGTFPTFETCYCCGVTFGHQDCTQDYVKKYRNKWMHEGGNWKKKELKPPNWSLEDQMKNIPEEFK